MLAQTYSLTHLGATTQTVTVETDVYNGLPGMSIVGLASKSIDEARDRIRSAIRNSNLQFPPRKVTVNLAPADITKVGTGYDLAIAMGLLIATGQVEQPREKICLIAELALNGELRPTVHTYASVLAAHEAGFTSIVIDPLSTIDTSLCEGLTIYRPINLKQLYQHFNGEVTLKAWVSQKVIHQSKSNTNLDMADIQGLDDVKQALVFSAVGHHNLLLVGPPGVGKSLIVSALPGILTTATQAERRSIHFLYSLADEDIPTSSSYRPFRNPHHTSSTIAMTGGGSYPRPGEISLAHHGILFLDEVAEFSRSTLEALRQPLETKQISIARAAQSVTFPANITLIAAMNPCPCGYYQSQQHNCACSPTAIKRYQQKLSGPLLDRFDMVCWVHPRQAKLLHKPIINDVNKTSKFIQSQTRKAAARDTPSKLDDTAQAALDSYIAQVNPSFRKQDRIRRLAQTAARLNNSPMITCQHIHTALYYQQALYYSDQENHHLPVVRTSKPSVS